MTPAAPAVLAIGGLDPSGWAGVLADAQTITRLGGRALAVTTALTIQSRAGVARVTGVSPRWVTAAVGKLFDDERPLAVKLGMLWEPATARALARLLEKRLGPRPLVIDPVLRSSSGAALFRGQVGRDYAPLFALARVVTPNLAEAAHLLGERIGERTEERAQAAQELSRLFRCAIVLKGGHAARDSDDLVAEGRTLRSLAAPRLPGSRPGTGCRFASALATRLASGDSVLSATRAAKAHVRRYLSEPRG